MWYFDIIRSSILIPIYAVLATIGLYVVIVLIMHAFNKYNTRNGLFILFSIIGIPFILVEFVMIFSLIKVKTGIVTSAQEYACVLASHIDGYKSDIIQFGENVAHGHEAPTVLIAGVAENLPDNPVELLLKKFPILANFLEDHNIQGNSAQEIMNAVFVNIKNYINSCIVGCVKWLSCFLCIMCGLSALYGWRKKKRKIAYKMS